MLWFLAFLVTATVFLYFKLKTVYSYWKRKGVPYDVPVPLFGMMLDMVVGRKSFIESVDEIYRAHPNERYVGYYQFTAPVLLLRDPDLIKQICVKDFDVFPEHRSNLPEDVEPFWSKNLVAVNAQRWRNLRPIMSPAFTSSKLKIIFDRMQQCAIQFSHHFLDQKPDTIDVELKDIFTRYTNDVIAATTFGLHVDSLKDQNNEFYVMGKTFATFKKLATLKFFLYDVLTTPMKWLNVKIFDEKAVAYFGDLLKEATRIREQNNMASADVLSLLLQARRSEGKGVDIGDEDIAAQAMIFFLGGFETVATALCFTIYELALDQDVQDRLREEIDKVWEEEDENITSEVILKMKYLDMVVSESFRKNPPMLVTDRQAARPYTIEPASEKEKSLHLPKNQMVLYSIYSLHNDEKYFPDPKRFDPERFSDENKHKIKQGTYVPFGVGPRNCIGARFALLEVKTLIFHVLRNFQVVPNDQTEVPVKLLKDRFVPVAENGFYVSFKKRHT